MFIPAVEGVPLYLAKLKLDTMESIFSLVGDFFLAFGVCCAIPCALWAVLSFSYSSFLIFFLFTFPLSCILGHCSLSAYFSLCSFLCMFFTFTLSFSSSIFFCILSLCNFIDGGIAASLSDPSSVGKLLMPAS